MAPTMRVALAGVVVGALAVTALACTPAPSAPAEATAPEPEPSEETATEPKPSEATAPEPAPPEALEVTEDDDGSSQAMSVGQLLRVTLESNPTTGYSWAVDGALPPQLRQVGEPEFGRSSDAIGAGGNEVWTFEAVAAGDAPLALKYWRPFEPDSPPPATFRVEISVR